MTTAAELASYASSFPSFRNRIINGDMRIDQRNAGGAITSGYPVDRFNTYSAGITNWQAQQISEGPAGFSKSVKYTCTPSIETPDATDYLNFVQRIEGFNFYDFNYGTTDAKSFTLSFYLKTNLAGTYGISFHNNAFNRVYVATYTVSVSDAAAENWVRYSILVPGDTSSSTWEVGNLVGITIEFCLSIGSDRDGATGSWSSTSSVFGAIGQVNLLSSTSNYWQITGVQLEKGTVATPFEHRPYGTELALCQRYFQTTRGVASSMVGTTGYVPTVANTAYRVGYELPVTMRATPSVTLVSLDAWDGTTVASITALSSNFCDPNRIDGDWTLASDLNDGRICRIYQTTGGTSRMDISAEL